MNYSFQIRLVLFSLLYFVKFSSEEWIEIPQIGEKKNFGSGTHSFGGPGSELSTPSQAWLDYQIDRFGLHAKPTTQSTVVRNVNKFVVTDRMDYPNQSEPYKPPVKGHDAVHSDPQGYDIDININRKPSSGQTTLLSNRNKFTVTASNSGHVEDDYEEADVGEELPGGFDKIPEPISPTPLTEDTKLSSFQKFVEYIKSFQKDFMTKTKQGIRDKVKYLHRLRDHLLFEIEDRIKGLWNEESDKSGMKKEKINRSKRGIFPEDTFMAFPSTEGALMTINFLTFAVFLIKLVLQVIKTLKSKHYAFNGFSVNTMEGIKLAKSRKSRSYQSHPGNHNDYLMEVDINSAKILNSIYNYSEKIKSSV